MKYRLRMEGSANQLINKRKPEDLGDSYRLISLAIFQLPGLLLTPVLKSTVNARSSNDPLLTLYMKLKANAKAFGYEPENEWLVTFIWNDASLPELRDPPSNPTDSWFPRFHSLRGWSVLKKTVQCACQILQWPPSQCIRIRTRKRIIGNVHVARRVVSNHLSQFSSLGGQTFR